jgi:hypothetical protein
VSGRLAIATSLGLRELGRRPLLLVLLVALPIFFITRSIAATVPQPTIVPLPGGGELLSNMQDVHGATMAAITVAFLAGLCGLFVLQSAQTADRRLVVAGYRPAEVVLPRLVVIGAATAIVVAVSLAVTAISFTPQQWLPFVAASVLIGLTFAGIGALAGVGLGRLGGTYFMLFLPMIDLGIAQTPMFGDGAPDGWAYLLPGYGAGRVAVDGAFSHEFHAWGELALAVAWAVATLAVVAVVLSRSLGTTSGPARTSRDQASRSCRVAGSPGG